MALENIDLSKFEKLFSSMERQLIMQSSFLESMYNLAVDEREDRISRQNELDIARVEDRARYDQQLEDSGRAQITTDQRDSLFSSLFGMIPGILSGISLAGVGSLLIKGGMLAIIAPAIGKFVEGFINQALTELEDAAGFELPGEFKSGISAVLGDAAKWFTIGKLIGGKFGALFGATGFIYEQFETWLDPDGDNEINSGFLKGFDTRILSAIGTALAVVLGKALPKLITKFLPGILAGLILPKVLPEAPLPVPPPGPPGAPPPPGPPGAATPPPGAPAAPKGKGILSRIWKGLKRGPKAIGGGVIGILGQIAAGAVLDEIDAALQPDVPDLDLNLGEDLTKALLNKAAQLAKAGKPEEAAEFIATEVENTLWGGGIENVDPRAIDPKFWKEWADYKKSEEIEGYKASGLYGEFNPAEGAAKTSAMVIPGVKTDATGAIQRPMLSAPAVEPISSGQSRLEKLEQMYQKSSEKSAVTTMNSFSSPTTVGGATHITNNNTTYHIASSASQSLDQAIIV